MKTDSFSKEKHLPVRRFIADESKVATGLYGPFAIADDIDNIHAMFDPEADILGGEQKGGIGEQNIQDFAEDSKEMAEYIHGNVVPSQVRGWTLVTAGGYSIGWGKGDGTVLKNHYPKGLRR